MEWKNMFRRMNHAITKQRIRDALLDYDHMTSPKNIYTVKQVNAYIKRMFEGDFVLRNIYIRGEISNFKRNSSGHLYFSLKDVSGIISAVMFANNAARLRFEPNEGMQVVVYGRISLYEQSGKYQIYVTSIEPDGIGDLYKRYEQLKQKLEEMGMFSDIYKKPIPRFAEKIGVVTSKTGSVIKDICSISLRRNPYCSIYLYSAKVQGIGASQTICEGIKELDKLNLDCIIIARGGGSIEDLWCFNDETVAQAIFNCNTPVISAVGHETDFTIADFVADLRAPTPSAAAELAVFEYDKFLLDLDGMRDDIERSMQLKLENARQNLERYKYKLESISPRAVLNDHKNRLRSYKSDIDSLTNVRLSSEKERLKLCSERLCGLSPLKRISEGYAYVSDNNSKAIVKVGDTKIGDIININVTDGSICARVEDIKEVHYSE